MKIDWELHIHDEVIRRVVERARQAIYDAAYNAALKALDEMEKDLDQIYYRVVREFYADYSPIFYRRNESLYDLLEIENTGDYLNWGFDSDKATPFERGGGSDGLYEHVFRRGWHGGATGTDKNGYTVNVPSWRTPVPWYSRWGAVAKQAPRSPLDAWEQEVSAYKEDILPQRYSALFHQNLQKYRI